MSTNYLLILNDLTVNEKYIKQVLQKVTGTILDIERYEVKIDDKLMRI